MNVRNLVVGVLLGTTLPAAWAEEAPRMLSVSGSATVSVVPDQVMISAGVEMNRSFPAAQNRAFAVGTPETVKASAALLAEAQAGGEAAVQEIRGALKALGVEEKHVKTESFQVEPIAYDSDGVRYFRGYLCRHVLSVCLSDPAKADACVDALLKHGATHLYGVTFGAKDVRKHRDQARRLACKAAREKADLLAGELGAKVKRVHNIGEGASSIWCGKNWGGSYGQQRMFGQNYSQQEESSAEAPGEEGGLPSGLVAISASVSVVFELE